MEGTTKRERLRRNWILDFRGFYGNHKEKLGYSGHRPGLDEGCTEIQGPQRTALEKKKKNKANISDLRCVACLNWTNRRSGNFD